MPAVTSPSPVVLVHGGGHGGWCWQRVHAQLADREIVSIAPDLPCEQPYGAQRTAELIVSAAADLPDEVVLVGHSLAGLVLPLVAQLRPVRHMVFVAAVLPVPGLSFLEQLASQPDILTGRLTDRTGPRELYYNACTDDDARWATAQLRTQDRTMWQEPTPLLIWPDVPSSYIACSEDAVCNPDWARENVPRLLGVEPRVLDGADHSPFLSRPAELAALVAGIAQSQAVGS